MLPWPPVAPGSSNSTTGTLLSAAIGALRPFTDAVVVVAGRNLESITPVAAASGASMVENPAPERGQFSSLQVGLREVVARGFEAAMITLVDCPPLSKASMEKLSAGFERALAKGRWGVAPEHSGRRGHPLIVSRELIDAFLAAPVSSNAREIKRRHSEMIEEVPVPDSLVSVDVNTPEEYRALTTETVKLD